MPKQVKHRARYELVIKYPARFNQVCADMEGCKPFTMVAFNTNRLSETDNLTNLLDFIGLAVTRNGELVGQEDHS